MIETWGSWVLSAVGLVGFVLAGKKVWWSWYINFSCQFLWLAYAIFTEQWGFIVAAIIYGVVFMRNAIDWTKEKFPSTQELMLRNQTKVPDLRSRRDWEKA